MSSPAEPRQDRGGWLLLLVLGGAQALIWGLGFAVSDVDGQYDFLGGDGRDWISNALALSGENVRFSARPPLFPGFLAVLLRLDVAGAWPFLGGLLLAALAALAYRVGRETAGRGVGLLVGLYVLANVPMERLALEVMADLLAATLVLAACLLFVAAGERPARYRWAGLVAAASLLTQQVAWLFVAAATAVVLLRRRPHLRRRELWQGVALLVVPVALWAVVKWFWVGTAGDYLVRNWSLLAFHLDAVPFYGHAALAFLGWPALWLIFLGGWRSLRDPTAKDSRLLAGLALLSTLVFFVLLYDWPARRFLLYVWVAALPFLARGLAALPTPARWVAGGLAVFFAAWPLARDQETAWLLSPLPAVAVVGPMAPLPQGSGLGERVAGDRRAARWRKLSWGDSWRRAVAVEAWRARRGEKPQPRLDPAWAEGASSVVFLAAPGDDRYLVLGRLGNAFRRRVKVVPAAIYPSDWWGWSCLGARQQAEGFGVAPWSCRPGAEPGTPEVLVAWAGAEPPPTFSAAEPRWPAGERAAWERARALGAAVSSPDGFLVTWTDQAPEAWQRALPFVARTSSLFVLEGERGAWECDTLAPSTHGERRQIAGCELVSTRYLGYRLEVVGRCAAWDES